MDITLQRILELLNRSGLDQKQFTQALGISSSAVSEWKKGKTKSYNKYIYQIAELFNVSAEYLLNKEIKNSAPEDTENADLQKIKFKELISQLVELPTEQLLEVLRLTTEALQERQHSRDE